MFHCTTILTALVICMLCAVVRYYARITRYGGPTTVWPTVPFLGDAFQFLYTPSQYFERCRLSYGPIFRSLVGGRRMVVICDDLGIQAALRDKTRALSTYAVHRDVCVAVADIDPEASHYLPDRLLPLTADIFSQAALRHITPSLNRVLYEYVESFKDTTRRNDHEQLTLSDFVGKGLYSAVSIGVFGAEFPTSTYPDFVAIDTNFLHLMLRLPLLTLSTRRSRTRLLRAIDQYIENAGPSCGAGTLPDPAAKILNTLFDLHLSTPDQNGMLLLFMWGLHSSSIRMAFWLLAYLLNNPTALTLVRDEIDRTLACDFPDVGSLLDAPAGALDGPNLSYLTSVVKEALRISSTTSPVREVSEDTCITLSTGETYALQKGEFITMNIPMMHGASNAYSSPLAFEASRFMENDGKRLPYLPWGSGEHVCKGRFLAMHTIKMFVIMVLRSLDLSVITNSGELRKTPFIPLNVTFMQRWQMRAPEPVRIRVSARTASQKEYS